MMEGGCRPTVSTRRTLGTPRGGLLDQGQVCLQQWQPAHITLFRPIRVPYPKVLNWAADPLQTPVSVWQNDPPQ